MLALFASMAGIFGTLILSELLWRLNILKGENQRKFVHISVFTFSAFLPWLISWEQIRILASLMLIGTLLNRYKKVLHFLGDVRREDYGDILMPVAIIACSFLTTNKIFFALAILQVSLADGLAAVVGVRYGRHWRYKVFRQEKTVVGSMAFWFVSLCIIGTGGLIAHDFISFSSYVALLLFLPPLLTGLENMSGPGFDNIIVPLLALVIIQLAYAS